MVSTLLVQVNNGYGIFQVTEDNFAMIVFRSFPQWYHHKELFCFPTDSCFQGSFCEENWPRPMSEQGEWGRGQSAQSPSGFLVDVP